MNLERLFLIVLFGLPMAAGAVIAFCLLIGRINTRGLVSDQTGSNSPARWQALFVSALGAASYLVTVLHDTGSSLPELPSWFTAGVLTSNAAYLVAKGAGQSSLTSLIRNFTGSRRD
jgi:hypothetical protein